MPCGWSGDFVEVECGWPAKPRSLMSPATAQDALGWPNVSPPLSLSPIGKRVWRPCIPQAWGGGLGAAAPPNLGVWEDDVGGPQNTLHCTDSTFPVLPWYQHPPVPALTLFPSSPPSCALSRLVPQELPPPTQGPGTATYISKVSFLEGRKKRGQCQCSKKMAPGTAQHLPVGQGLPWGTQGGHRGLQGAMVPSIPAAPSGHKAQAPTALPKHCCPQSITASSPGGQSEAPRSLPQWHTAPPRHNFSSPKFPQQLSPCLQPVQLLTAGGSERRRGHQWGPWARCGQGTAQLSTTSCTHPIQPQQGSWESQDAE